MRRHCHFLHTNRVLDKLGSHAGKVSHWYTHKTSGFKTSGFKTSVPRVQREEDQSAAGLLLRTHSAGPVSQTCLLRSKRRELLRTVVTLDDSTPQCRITELRVWSYEPFIVPASSSSGYLSGQYLEVLYIIRNSI
jgi:hypothetical protein